MSDSSINVSGLSLEGGRESKEGYRPHRSKAPWIVGAVIIALLALFAFVARDKLIPRPAVETVRALAIKSAGTAMPEGELSFQAAGWVEPAPFPIKITALVGGVVKSLSVIEGSTVKEGDLIAELNDENLQLELQAVDAERKRLEAAVKEMEAAHKVAIAASRHHEASIRTAKTKLSAYLSLAGMYEKSKGSVPKLEQMRASRDVAIQTSVIDELTAKQAVFKSAEVQAEARATAQNAELDAIAVDNARINLALKRTHIKAPATGVVLRILAPPGSRLNLNSSSADAATIAELYEPDKLQVRVDVPLADAGGLSVGQKAKISVEILPDRTFDGIVTSIVGRADVIRNTLQAKVKIVDPDGQLRPEMLAKVKFLSTGTPSKVGTQATGERLRVFIPSDAVSDDGRVWVVDRVSNALVSTSVTLGRETRDGWVEVTGGVNAGQQIVIGDRAGLREGQRVTAKLSEKEMSQ